MFPDGARDAAAERREITGAVAERSVSVDRERMADEINAHVRI
jgi:hypothetical protein